MTFRLSSSGSWALLKNWALLVVPVGPPSALAPLSEITMMRVLSSLPRVRRKSSSRPRWWSVWLRKPAKTSIIRLDSRWASGESESHSGTSGSCRDSTSSALGDVVHDSACRGVVHVVHAVHRCRRLGTRRKSTASPRRSPARAISNTINLSRVERRAQQAQHLRVRCAVQRAHGLVEPVPSLGVIPQPSTLTPRHRPGGTPLIGDLIQLRHHVRVDNQLP